jgi:hypothetical protein
MIQIKAISTPRFYVRLLEMESGGYRIEWLRQYDRIISDQPFVSELVKDLNTAIQLFDTKLIELEGN